MESEQLQHQFVDLMNGHRKILYKIAYIYCRHPDDRQDLVQEMLVQAWRSFARFDASVKFSTWLYRVATNTAISFNRQHQRRAVEMIPIDQLRHELDQAHAVFDDNSSAMLALRRLIDQLDEMSSALILLYLDGCSHEDISQALGISVSNVGTRLGRIKQKLVSEMP